MILAMVGTALACLAALGGLSLAWCYFSRKRAPRALLWGHPLGGTTALIVLWIAFALWHGPHNLPLDAGIIVITLAFVAGAFMFSLRTTRLPVPAFTIVLHALAALGGCALLIVGVVQVYLPGAG